MGSSDKVCACKVPLVITLAGVQLLTRLRGGLLRSGVKMIRKVAERHGELFQADGGRRRLGKIN